MTKFNGPDPVARLRRKGNKLYIEIAIVNAKMPVITRSLYPCAETVKDFTDGGVDIAADYNAILTSSGDNYRGERYYYHVASKTPDNIETENIAPPKMPDATRVRWYNGAWCSVPIAAMSLSRKHG